MGGAFSSSFFPAKPLVWPDPELFSPKKRFCGTTSLAFAGTYVADFFGKDAPSCRLKSSFFWSPPPPRLRPSMILESRSLSLASMSSSNNLVVFYMYCKI